MSLSRRLAENIYDNPTQEEIDDTKQHIRNISMIAGGYAIVLADAALAISADSWQADVLATPTGIAGFTLAYKGMSRVQAWMREGSSRDTSSDLEDMEPADRLE